MKHLKNIVRPYIVWAMVMIVIPLLLVFLYAFTVSGNSLVNIKFSLDNFRRFSDTVYLDVFLKSFRIGVVTTILCFIFGYPLAYAISKFKESVQSILILFVTIPMWINMLLRTYAWISIVSKNGLINSFLNKLGLGSINIMYTDTAVLIGLVCNFLPLMVIPIHTSLCKMDKTLIEAAHDLGANEFETFIKITFKLSMPGVINGVFIVFITAISSFIIPKLLGGGQYMLIGNLIETQFLHVMDWNFGSAISLILIVIIIAINRVLKKFDVEG